MSYKKRKLVTIHNFKLQKINLFMIKTIFIQHAMVLFHIQKKCTNLMNINY